MTSSIYAVEPRHDRYTRDDWHGIYTDLTEMVLETLSDPEARKAVTRHIRVSRHVLEQAIAAQAAKKKGANDTDT